MSNETMTQALALFAAMIRTDRAITEAYNANPAREGKIANWSEDAQSEWTRLVQLHVDARNKALAFADAHPELLEVSK